MRAIHHYGIHAHQSILSDVRSMQHGTMSYVPVDFDDRIAVRETVNHASVLNICAVSQRYASEIAAQAGGRPDITARSDDHVADQYGRGMHISRRIDNWDEIFNRIAVVHWSSMMGAIASGSVLSDASNATVA